MILNLTTLTCLVSQALVACGPAEMEGYEMSGEDISIEDTSDNMESSELRKRKAFLKYLTCEDRNLDSHSRSINVDALWNDYVTSALSANNIPTTSALQQGFEAMHFDDNDPLVHWAGGQPFCHPPLFKVPPVLI